MNKKKKNLDYTLRKRIYFSLKDISLGMIIFSERGPIYGTKGRVTGIDINIIFFHFKVGIVRSGF